MSINVRNQSPWEFVDMMWIWFKKPSRRFAVPFPQITLVGVFLMILIYYRTSTINIRVSIEPEVDIGWISSIAASIYYGGTLIGEITQEDEFVLSEELDNTYDIVLKDFEIQDMIAFKTLIRNTMPNTKDRRQPRNIRPLARLRTAEKGHKLEVAINLHGTGSIEIGAHAVRLTGDSIEITFFMSNSPHVEFFFGETVFVLERDGETLAYLDSNLLLEAAGGDPVNYYFRGKLPSYAKLFGKAKLRGSSVKGEEKTWFIHAIREFEFEVDLDQVIVCEDE
ncbi:hypothetical protein A0O28_0035350 [Trichoderma guizhouense]|uniref:Uncharacterized protein n=1 Tax=Trichoderma guizhouense TaxID=1491466 RepID=A0A1T3CMT7_9HYPO|nr:hypothetical protein A0O28_0035350 [Trichoderma guizhouense]